jgi:hypothetical protein
MTLIPEDATVQDVNDANRSVLSNLTDDISQGRSLVSRMSTGITSVLAESWAIMTEAPREGQVNEPETIEDKGKHEDLSGTLVITSSMNYSEEQAKPLAIDFLQDDPVSMTYGRRIALFLSKRSWYNPQLTRLSKDDSGPEQPPLIERRPPKITRKENPSLAKAWAYFDHFVLPRYIVAQDGSFNRHDLKRAEPGECTHPTRLYHPLCTPLSQMGDFGLGVGLYFSTLQALTLLTFLAGLMNYPNFIYFSGPLYSQSQIGVDNLLKGSSICTVQNWVPCEGCNPNDFTANRFAKATKVIGIESGVSNIVNLTFALKNDCAEVTLQQGMISYGTLIFLFVGILFMHWYQRRKEVDFDEDEQTAQDYSIRIMNPPSDAVNPEEWRAFFKDNFDAHATVVTIALDNDPLIRALKERRECLRRIELNLEPGTSLDILTLAKIAAEVETSRRFWGKAFAILFKGIPEYFGRMAELEAKIKGWAQLDYPCSNVFITFETEAEQRRVLSHLEVGSYHVRSQNRAKLEDKCLFRGHLVLSVKEPDEPSTIRWADLNVRAIDKFKPLATTTISSIMTIILIAMLIHLIHDRSPSWAAIAIAIANSLFPMVAKLLTNLERHSSEGPKQTSLYFKIAMFRWVNTAVVITIITPFTATLSLHKGLIPSIYAIFFADIVTTNVVQVLDPVGHFKRHFLAPRAATQDAMNLAMQGAEIQLAERYTNMTKILFLAVWYCSLFPATLFLCSFALGIIYLTDRFSLMRTWKRIPQLGTRISQFSRRYFLSASIVAMAIVSAYSWAGFPFDNLCKNDSPVNDAYIGRFNLTRANGHVFSEVIINSNDASYRYCLQDMIRFRNVGFPALSKWQPKGDEWMSDEQEILVDIFGWTSLVFLGFAALFIVFLVVKSVLNMFTAKHVSCGEDQGIPFSQVPSISTFVPQVESSLYSYPLLACHSNGVDVDLFDWTDPERPHSYYDLTEDADELIGDRSVRDKLVFSIVSHVPSPEFRSVSYQPSA